jgi:hypothetical protein
MKIPALRTQTKAVNASNMTTILVAQRIGANSARRCTVKGIALTTENRRLTDAFVQQRATTGLRSS